METAQSVVAEHLPSAPSTRGPTTTSIEAALSVTTDSTEGNPTSDGASWVSALNVGFADGTSMVVPGGERTSSASVVPPKGIRCHKRCHLRARAQVLILFLVPGAANRHGSNA